MICKAGELSEIGESQACTHHAIKQMFNSK